MIINTTAALKDLLPNDFFSFLSLVDFDYKIHQYCEEIAKGI